MAKDKPKPTNPNPRLIALETVDLVLEKGAYTNIALDKVLKRSHLTTEDRHLVTEIVSGTIRMLKHLDWVLNLFLQQPVEKQNPWLRNILRISLYQMLFMDKIPDYASVNSGVELCRAKSGDRLASVVNGVLRNVARHRNNLRYPDKDDAAQYLAVFYSQPEWLISKWLQEFEQVQVVEMLDYFNRRPALVLRNNGLRASRSELIEIMTGEGIKSRASQLTPWGVRVEELEHSLAKLDSYRAGLFYVQNEASMLAISILDPKPGENLADLASGVGGKTTFMAERMGNCGHIYAYELYRHKLNILEDNCRRLGITIVSGHEQDLRSLTAPERLLDGLLLDVPCSGLGVLNRRVDARWNKHPDELAELSVLQSELLVSAAAMVAPAGRLVYCTCTINPAENQDIVNQFLANHSEFQLESFSREIAFFPLDEGDYNQAGQGMLTILPGKYDTDGMFYAKIRKSGSIGE